MDFADLPNEILTIICSYIGIRDLKEVRLASKILKNPATQRLFRVIILKPQAESIDPRTTSSQMQSCNPW